MKRIIVSIIIFALLGSAVLGLQFFNRVNANFLPREKPSPPPIIIHSPLNSTYNQNDVLLNFTIVGISHFWTPAYHLTNLYYVIDGKSYSLTFDSRSNIEQHSAELVSLPKGKHTLTVHAEAAGVYYSNYPNSGTSEYSIESTETVSFTINTEPENTPTPIPMPSSTAQNPQLTSPPLFPTPTPTQPLQIPEPEVPEFKVELFSSQTENNSTIRFEIRNQPYDTSPNYYLFYNIRYRADGGDWTEVYRPDDGYPTQSDSDFTILEFHSSEEYEGYFLDTSTNPPWSFAIRATENSTLEIQVNAMIGYIHRVFNPNSTSQMDMYPYVFTGEKSEWSNVEKVIMSESSSVPTNLQKPSSNSSEATASNSRTDEPTQSPLSIGIKSKDQTPLVVVVIIILTILIIASSAVYLKRRI